MVPSEESWAAVRRILDEKDGVCGYVVEKVNVRGIVQKLVDKGFNVRLPTEKIKPMAVPVGIEPTMEVRGQPVALAIQLGDLAITEDVIWLGARVSVAVGEEAAKEIEERKAEQAKKQAGRKKGPAGPSQASGRPALRSISRQLLEHRRDRRLDGGGDGGRHLVPELQHALGLDRDDAHLGRHRVAELPAEGQGARQVDAVGGGGALGGQVVGSQAADRLPASRP